MKIYINEKECEVPEETSLMQLKNKIKKAADVIVYNGFIQKEDISLKAYDNVVFIKNGEVPRREDMEAQLTARHTPRVHEKVKKAVVGIAGLGGLGSNAAVALARIGVGKLILVDFDVVEPSNLNRQQYFIRHIGMKKTEALKEIIGECNPFVEAHIVNAFLDENNIEEIFKEAHIIIEAFDNPVSKAVLTNTVLSKMKDKKIIAASGMAGYFPSNTIVTRKVRENFYIVGDMENEAQPGMGLMAPRVSIAANHEANAALRIIMNEE